MRPNNPIYFRCGKCIKSMLKEKKLQDNFVNNH